MFDPVLKQLTDNYPEAWVGFLQRQMGLPATGPVEIIDTNLSSFVLDADRAFRVSGPVPHVVHLEVESSRPTGRADRFLKYNVMLTDRTELPVQTVVVLLRKEAASPDFTGLLERFGPDVQPYLTWRFGIIRLWEVNPEDILACGPGLAPLAPLGQVDEAGIPRLVEQIDEQLRNTSNEDAIELKAAMEILLGLRFSTDFIKMIMRGGKAMEESVVYQEIIAKGEARGEALGEARGVAIGETRGRAVEARRLIIRLLSRRIGAPDGAVRENLDLIDDVDRLERMTDAIDTARSWDDVLVIE